MPAGAHVAGAMGLGAWKRHEIHGRQGHCCELLPYLSEARVMNSLWMDSIHCDS